MFFIQKKLWIAWSKFRFLKLPVEKRVRLEVTMDGRHLTFLLTALGEEGYGVHVVGAPFVFRELMCLRKSVPMPFVVGGEERKCGILITDKSGFNQGKFGGGKRVFLDYNYFSGLTTKRHESEVEELTTESTEDTEIDGGLRLESQASASELDSLTSKLAHAPVSESLIRSADGPTSSTATSYLPPVTAPEAIRMPYFMHPSVYHKGLHTKVRSERARKRHFRLGFFGTHDREFYTKHYHFPGMNRFEILEVFLQKFGNRIKHLRGFPRDWDPCEIAGSIDGRGGDRKGKSFLSQVNYFQALRECDFVLSPPGWCMPISHSLIEAMFCGAIPITNGRAFMAEPLADGETCLEFQDTASLVSVIDRAMVMDDHEVAWMHSAVSSYYNRFLAPGAFFESLIRSNSARILVNAEEKSAPLIFPEKIVLFGDQ